MREGVFSPGIRARPSGWLCTIRDRRSPVEGVEKEGRERHHGKKPRNHAIHTELGDVTTRRARWPRIRTKKGQSSGLFKKEKRRVVGRFMDPWNLFCMYAGGRT